jgi:SAM-dependent methyltransferase
MQRYFDGKLPLDRCLSLACGEGRLERYLAQLGMFRQCDAFDVSEESISMASSKAELAGIHGIHYEVADINELKLDRSVYDAIFIDSGAHHFENLEHVFQELACALKPGGLLLLNEYVGPNRFQFPERQKEIASLCLRLIPRRYRILPAITPVTIPDGVSLSAVNVRRGILWAFGRLIDKLRDRGLKEVVARRFRKAFVSKSGPGATKDEISFTLPRDVSSIDPSEAVRSEDIMPVISQFFEIVERRDWGGSILQFLLSDIAGNFKDEDPESIAIIKMLANIEEMLIRSGELQSDFAFIVAQPRESV